MCYIFIVGNFKLEPQRIVWFKPKFHFLTTYSSKPSDRIYHTLFHIHKQIEHSLWPTSQLSKRFTASSFDTFCHWFFQYDFRHISSFLTSCPMFSTCCLLGFDLPNQRFRPNLIWWSLKAEENLNLVWVLTLVSAFQFNESIWMSAFADKKTENPWPVLLINCCEFFFQLF